MRVFLLLVCCFLSHFSFAQWPASLLWKVSGNGLETPSYLYGTMHLDDPRVFEFGDSVLVKLNGVTTVVGELDLSQPPNMAAALTLMKMPDSIKLRDLVSNADYKLIKQEAMSGMGYAALMIDDFKPMFTQLLLEQTKMAKAMESDDYKGHGFLDSYLQEYAVNQNKEVAGLESFEEQMHALDSYSLEAQAKDLVEYVQSESEGLGGTAELSELVELYRQQDLEGIWQFYGAHELPENANEALLEKRNERMSHRIDSMVRNKDCFVAIGTLHLPGPKGIIKLLRAKGYTVEPIFSKCSQEITFSNKNAGWQTVAPNGELFTFDVPGIPEKYTDSQVLMGDTLDATFFHYPDGKNNFFYTVQYATVPPFWSEKKDLTEFMERSATAWAGQQVELTEMAWNGLQVFEFEFPVEHGLHLRYRSFAIDNKVVTIALGGEKGETFEATWKQFYNGIGIL